MVACVIVQGVLWFVSCAVDGDYAMAVFYLIFSWFGCGYYFTWLLSSMRERMQSRFKGKLAEHAQRYTARLLQISSLQMALLVQGLAKGIGPHSTGHNYAINTFAQSLISAWLFSAGVFDAGEADVQRLARLRLSFRESVALASSMLYVLMGLAGYVMAQQDNPDASAAELLNMMSFTSVVVAAALVGRLVKTARKNELLRVQDSGSISVQDTGTGQAGVGVTTG